MSTPFQPKWNLQSLATEKSLNETLELALEKLQKDLDHLRGQLLGDSSTLKSAIVTLQEITKRVYNAQSIIHCLMAQDVQDQRAIQLNSQAANINAIHETVTSILEKKLIALSEAEFQKTF